MQWKINWHGDLFTNGENLHCKNSTGWFKGTIPENSLLSQQAITSKGIPVPYTNLQLNFYPNIQLDLFYSDNLSFQCMALSTWLANSICRSQYATYIPTWEGCWLQNSSVHQHDEDHETLWLQNLTVYKHNSFLKRKMN